MSLAALLGMLYWRVHDCTLGSWTQPVSWTELQHLHVYICTEAVHLWYPGLHPLYYYSS
jgi:hypothetical protein